MDEIDNAPPTGNWWVQAMRMGTLTVLALIGWAIPVVLASMVWHLAQRF